MTTVIDVENVSVAFRMQKERTDSLKEYVLMAAKRKLQYEDFYALSQVTFQVKQGDVFGIVGLNGSGKSTLLKTISGILNPTSGKVSIKGAISPLIELGAGFDLELTARENIFLNGAVLGYTKKELLERFDDIVDFSEMKDFLEIPMKNYSSGMVARLAFAIATSRKPEILIVDEILSVGDFQFQLKCEQRINHMIQSGTTVLLVSHSIEQIERLCNNALWLEHGKMKKVGKASDVCSAYKIC